MLPNPRVVVGVLIGRFVRGSFGEENPFGIDDEACFDRTRDPEFYGATDINAQVANQHLAVAVNDDGTVTVFRYPTPSYYDQIKYRTAERDAPLLGAEPNEGAFLGVGIEDGDRTVFEPFRTWETSQEHAGGTTDTLVTTHESDRWGLRAVVTDVVPPATDAFVRDVEITRTSGGAPEAVSLVAFENFNLVCSKTRRLPVRDWCLERSNRDRAAYLPDADAITHLTREQDVSTGTPNTVATAMGFQSGSAQFQVGGDAYEPSAADPERPSVPADAFEDAADGTLEGNAEFAGQTTGALSTPLSFVEGVATERVLITAAHTAGDASPPVDTRARAVGKLERVRGAHESTADLRDAKRAWVRDHLADAPMPDTDDEAILGVCRRALVSLVTTFHPENGAVVASIATQSPYAEDWPRDSAFFNYVLDLIGKPEWVERRNRWFADLQSERPIGEDPLVPPGNWAMNYYADGVPGAPIPWEIDETGYLLWAFWDHYKATGDRDYLASVYGAIERAADFLSLWLDPRNGLHVAAWEDDNVEPGQTLVGAGPIWLGLDSAVKAAAELGQRLDASLWRLRRKLLARGIERRLYDSDGGFYGTRSRPGFPEHLWPIVFRPYDDPRMRSHAERAWTEASASLAEPEAGELSDGRYEPKHWLGLAKIWQDDEELLARVRDGLRWSARRHATDDTHVMGESWRNIDGEIVSAVSQPHLWEMCLFYLAALEAFPPVADGVDRRSAAGGWLERLRGDPIVRRIRA